MDKEMAAECLEAVNKELEQTLKELDALVEEAKHFQAIIRGE